MTNEDIQRYRMSVAEKALVAMVRGGYSYSDHEFKAKLAVKYADALIAELKLDGDETVRTEERKD